MRPSKSAEGEDGFTADEAFMHDNTEPKLAELNETGIMKQLRDVLRQNGSSEENDYFASSDRFQHPRQNQLSWTTPQYFKLYTKTCIRLCTITAPTTKTTFTTTSPPRHRLMYEEKTRAFLLGAKPRPKPAPHRRYAPLPTKAEEKLRALLKQLPGECTRGVNQKPPDPRSRSGHVRFPLVETLCRSTDRVDNRPLLQPASDYHRFRRIPKGSDENNPLGQHPGHCPRCIRDHPHLDPRQRKSNLHFPLARNYGDCPRLTKIDKDSRAATGATVSRKTSPSQAGLRYTPGRRAYVVQPRCITFKEQGQREDVQTSTDGPEYSQWAIQIHMDHLRHSQGGRSRVTFSAIVYMVIGRLESQENR